MYDNQNMMSFPVGVVAQVTVRADVCDAVVSNESEVLEFCIEGEGCVIGCVCVCLCACVCVCVCVCVCTRV